MPFTLYRVEDANQGGPYNGADKQLVRDALPHLFSSEGIASRAIQCRSVT
jgi:hypothetical protein